MRCFEQIRDYLTKEQALENYKEAKRKLTFKDLTEKTQNWLDFCDAKRDCMRLGIKI